MREQPLVSVLITAYNREKYVGEAIESVLTSSYVHFEIIICDDYSTDHTVLIAEGYAQRDDRVKVFRNPQNLGDYRNRNQAATFAKGKYLKYLDSDDTIYPWGLEAMVYCMEKYPEAGFGLMSYNLPLSTAYPILLSGRESYSAFFFRQALLNMGPSGAIIRRDVFEQVNGFSGKPYLGDTEMWLRMAQSHSLVRMPTDLIWWREHDQQQIKEEQKNINIETQRFLLMLDCLNADNCPLPAAERQMAVRNLKNVRCRLVILRRILRGKIAPAYRLMKESKLNWRDIVKSFQKNKYPH